MSVKQFNTDTLKELREVLENEDSRESTLKHIEDELELRKLIFNLNGAFSYMLNHLYKPDIRKIAEYLVETIDEQKRAYYEA
jgi:hypothetical protein